MAVNNACFKVAAIQMNSVNDKEANLKKAEEFINLAAKEGTKIVALPEMFNFSGTSREKKRKCRAYSGVNYKSLKRACGKA